MSAQQLQESFAYCKSHDDPSAWLALALAYYQDGYPMNALYCFEQADKYEPATV